MATQRPVLLPSSDNIILEAEFPNSTPELLFDHFVRPALITRWFAPVAVVHARQGGTFHYAWPDLDLHLRGMYTMVERGALLAFTWQWDHEKTSGQPARTVRVTFSPCARGARLRIEHGPYAAHQSADRQAHAEAWQYYLERLQTVAAPAGAA